MSSHQTVPLPMIRSVMRTWVVWLLVVNVRLTLFQLVVPLPFELVQVVPAITAPALLSSSITIEVPVPDTFEWRRQALKL
jgi:hypothetical protein